MTSLAQEIRANFAKIRRKYEGHPDAIAPLRVDHIAAVEAHIDALEAHVAGCTCQPERGFEINTDRADAGPYELMSMARIDRLLGVK